jgi:hypothetical protein
MSGLFTELPTILIWVAVWGIVEILIERYIKNTFTSRIIAHAVLLVGAFVLEYIYDFNGNGKMF